MADYRFYFLTDKNEVVRHIEQPCEYDLSALNKARALAWDHTIDIWQDDRRVAMVGPNHEPLVYGDPYSPDSGSAPLFLLGPQ